MSDYAAKADTTSETVVPQWLRWGLLVAAVLTGVAQLWFIPITASPQELAYVASHATHPQFAIIEGGASTSPTGAWLRFSTSHGTAAGYSALWRDRVGMVHQTRFPDVDPTRSDAATARLRLEQAINSAARRPVVYTTDDPTSGGVFRGVEAVVGVGMLLFLVLGNFQPRRATKWATFWIWGLPFNLGVAWSLLRDAPWSRSFAVLPRPVAGDTTYRVPEGLFGRNRPRLGGVIALLVSIVLGSLLQFGVEFALSHLLHGPESASVVVPTAAPQ